MRPARIGRIFLQVAVPAALATVLLAGAAAGAGPLASPHYRIAAGALAGVSGRVAAQACPTVARPPCPSPVPPAAQPQAGGLDPTLARALEQRAAAGPLAVELFVMSRCPYGNLAEDALLPWLAAHPAVNFSLQFIADQAAGAAAGARFTSLHGPAEVTEDLRQVAVSQAAPGKLAGYLQCRAGNYQQEDGWRACAARAGLDPSRLADPDSDPAAAEGLAASLQHAASLDVHASPTLYLNGERYANTIFMLPAAAGGCR